MGKLGRTTSYMLSDITSSGEGDVDAFVEITPDSLLHNIQSDILDLEIAR
ncbi:exodeoxyribonuclease V subunit gamma [Enterobacter cloacae]|uniref:Exodeoxyribonuclease V subunit gamma n=1 Tax=Enterobacter cloacae TaxID=550 RepID=A0A377LTM4_ENTCL|nr:exodeoxyribonuclease V subunit gamma [Enterobacter cloacae]